MSSNESEDMAREQGSVQTDQASLRLSGTPQSFTIASGTEFVIGRDDDSDLALDDLAVSRPHARIFHDVDAYRLEDMNSLNGTFVERDQEVISVDAPVSLHSGDVILIGPFRVFFEQESAERIDPQHAQPWGSAIHVPTVVAGFSHFFSGFFIWALAAVLANDIGEDLNLSANAVKLLPISTLVPAAFARFFIGHLTDSRGPLIAGSLALSLGLIPLAALWLAGDTQVVLWPSVAMLGLGLAALPVSVPMASQRTAPQRRGIVLGIVSSGSIGIVLAAFTAPHLASAFDSWQTVFGLAIIIEVLALLLFVWGARGKWTSPPFREWVQTSRSLGFWVVSLLFGVTFGSFAGLYSFLPVMLQDVDLDYQLGAATAATIVGLGALMGGGARVIGGFLADRYGALRVLPYSIGGAAILLVVAGGVPVVVALVIFVSIMTLFEAGTGKVLKLASQRFGASVGAGTGILGATGSLIAAGVGLLMAGLLNSTGEPWAALALLAAVSGVATWLILAARLQHRGEPMKTLAVPHLQRLDYFGNSASAVEIGSALTIGRAPGNRLLLANDDLVSRRHATIQAEDGGYLIRDLSSTNGTSMWRENQWRSIDTEELHEGDVIVLGSTVFQFSTGASAGRG